MVTKLQINNPGDAGVGDKILFRKSDGRIVQGQEYPQGSFGQTLVYKSEWEANDRITDDGMTIKLKNNSTMMGRTYKSELHIGSSFYYENLYTRSGYPDETKLTTLSINSGDFDVSSASSYRHSRINGNNDSITIEANSTSSGVNKIVVKRNSM